MFRPGQKIIVIDPLLRATLAAEIVNLRLVCRRLPFGSAVSRDFWRIYYQAGMETLVSGFQHLDQTLARANRDQARREWAMLFVGKASQ